MSRIYASPSGSWGNVADGDKVRYWNGSGYAIATEVRVWNGSSWVSVWSKSNPVTVSFYPTFATNMRWNGSSVSYDSSGLSPNNAATDLYNGRYAGGTNYHYVSLLQFTGGSIQGLGTLAQLMASRPVVKSASLRLNRVSGGLGSPVGYLRIGTWTQANAQNLPATVLDGTYNDWDPKTVNGIGGWSYGSNRDFPVNVQQIYDLNAGKTLMFAEVESGYTTSGSTTNAYMRIYGMLGSDPGKLPILTVTLDII